MPSIPSMASVDASGSYQSSYNLQDLYDSLLFCDEARASTYSNGLPNNTSGSNLKELRPSMKAANQSWLQNPQIEHIPEESRCRHMGTVRSSIMISLHLYA